MKKDVNSIINTRLYVNCSLLEYLGTRNENVGKNSWRNLLANPDRYILLPMLLSITFDSHDMLSWKSLVLLSLIFILKSFTKSFIIINYLPFFVLICFICCLFPCIGV